MRGILIDPSTETIQKVTLEKDERIIWKTQRYWTDTDYLYQTKDNE